MNITKRTIHPTGYVVLPKEVGIECPFSWKDGRCYEHVYKIWKKMERGEVKYDPRIHVIHHKNGNRADNRLSNLQVMYAKHHTKITLF